MEDTSKLWWELQHDDVLVFVYVVEYETIFRGRGYCIMHIHRISSVYDSVRTIEMMLYSRRDQTIMIRFNLIE